MVEASAAEVEPFETMDRTRRFARVRADGGEPLGGDCFAAGDRIVTALSAETVGVAQKAMEMAVEYARERKQFGRAIGAYQAVSHRCAQMLLEVEGSRSGAYYAALVRGRRAGVAAGGRLDGQGLLLGRRLARVRRPRSRCTAASASPGSTTCTSSSSGRRRTGCSTAPRASTASAWPSWASAAEAVEA